MNTIRTAIIAAVIAAGALSANAASAFERWFYVNNEGSSTIYSVYATPVGDHSWGRDLLGSYVIPAGDYLDLEPDYHNGYCLFDIKVRYASGREVTLWNVDLCTITDVYTNGHYIEAL